MNGIINVKKEAGMTSHDAVFKLRKILHQKKIGHGGTLDPDVVGVLPIAVGKATKVLEYMTDASKVYQGEITIGFSTSTEDASGNLIEQTPLSQDDLQVAAIDEAMSHFIGKIKQIPPMYSAVKINGKKLYEYAREGKIIDRPAREVMIYEFKRTSQPLFENGLCRFTFRAHVGKGTYIRTLAVDLGRYLGYASHMSFLERVSAAGLDLGSSWTLAEIKELYQKEDYSFLLPIEEGVQSLEKVELTQEEVQELSFGRFIHREMQASVGAGFCEGKLVAILEKRQGDLKAKKFLGKGDEG